MNCDKVRTWDDGKDGDSHVLCSQQVPLWLTLMTILSNADGAACGH
jgi:hypothetical protein